MSHPDRNGPPDRTPLRPNEAFENPVTREHGTVIEWPWKNAEGRLTADLTTLAGARVVGEHRHPALVERFTVLEGELTVKRAGETSILREGETADVEPGVWHDWWNASDRDARVRVEVTPGESLAHLIETLFGLARLGHTTAKGMPNPCSSRCSRENSGTWSCFGGRRRRCSARSSPFWAPIAHRRGYRVRYPQPSRTLLARRRRDRLRSGFPTGATT